MAIHDRLNQLVRRFDDLESEYQQLSKEVAKLKTALDSYTSTKAATAPKKATGS